MRAKQLFGYYSLLTVGSFMIMTKCGFNTIFLDVLFRFFKESLSDGHDYCLGTWKASPSKTLMTPPSGPKNIHLKEKDHQVTN